MHAFLYLGLRDALGKPVALFLGFAMSCGGMITYSWGMETSWYLALVCACGWALSKDRLVLAAVLAGLVAVMRPDGLLLLPLVAALQWWRHGRFPFKMVVLGAIPIAIWLLASLFWLDGLVPHTMKVKSVQADIGWFSLQPAWFVAFLKQPVYPLVTFSLALMGTLSVWRRKLFKDMFTAVLIGFGGAQALGFSVLGAPSSYWWYFAPANMALNLLVGIGLMELIKRMGKLARVEGNTVGWKAYLPAVLILVAFYRVGASPFHRLFPYRYRSEYIKAANWIRAHSPKGTWVAATEIGYLGYESDREIRDIHGLLHGASLTHLEQG